MYCFNCGYETNSKFCPQCGTACQDIVVKDSIEPKVKKKFYKKWWFWIIIVFIIVLVIGISSSGDSKSTDSYNAKVETTIVNSNEIGDYSVEILKARLSSNYDGKLVVVVTYKYTNNTNDTPTAFFTAFDDEVYQKGVSLNKAYILKEGDPYNENDIYKELKKGASLEVEQAYILNDLTVPIDVEVSETFSFDNRTISKTFRLR